MSVFQAYLGGQQRQAYDKGMSQSMNPMEAYGQEAGIMSGTEAVDGVTAEAQSALDKLFSAYGSRLPINSAYRSPEHNAKVGGAKHSQHTHGNAFDLDVSDLPEAERIRLIELARSSGFKGVGVYDNALHFDVGPERAWGPSYSRDSLPKWASAAVSNPMESYLR